MHATARVGADATPSSQSVPAAPVTLKFRPEGLRKLLRISKTERPDHEVAALFGVDRGTFSRVVTGKNKPGPGFIAGALRHFGPDCFADLFAIVPDEDNRRAA